MHRDIKPENLLLSEEYEVKLADFGLAINIDAQAPISRVGTLDYMAPEVGLPLLCCPFVPFSHQSCAYCTEVPPLDVFSLCHMPTALDFPLWIAHPLGMCLLHWSPTFACTAKRYCAGERASSCHCPCLCERVRALCNHATELPQHA